jgi:hypothetical protein
MALDYYEDAVVDVIADEHPLVLALLPMLVAKCTAASHVERNPGGVLEVSVGSLARALRTTPEGVRGCLAAMEEGEILTVREERKITLVTLCRFDKWQQPVRSRAFRKRQQRGDTTSRGFTPHGTAQGPDVSHPPTPTPTPTQKDHPLTPSDTSEASTRIAGVRTRLGGTALLIDELDSHLQVSGASPADRFNNLWQPAEALIKKHGKPPVEDAVRAAVAASVSRAGVKKYLIKASDSSAQRAAEKKNADPALMTREERAAANRQAAIEKVNKLKREGKM